MPNKRMVESAPFCSNGIFFRQARAACKMSSALHTTAPVVMSRVNDLKSAKRTFTPMVLARRCLRDQVLRQAVCEMKQHLGQIVPVPAHVHVLLKRGFTADAFGLGIQGDFAAVNAVRTFVHPQARNFRQNALEATRQGLRCKLRNRVHAHRVELLLRLGAHAIDFAHRQGPDDGLKLLRTHHAQPVGLLQVGTNLGGQLVLGQAHRTGHAAGGLGYGGLQHERQFDGGIKIAACFFGQIDVDFIDATVFHIG